MNIDKFGAAFTEALLAGPAKTPLPAEIYDHAKSTGVDVSGYVRVDEAEERRKVKAALDQERRNGEYLRLRHGNQAKPVKPGKAARKARMQEAQRKALVGK